MEGANESTELRRHLVIFYLELLHFLVQLVIPLMNISYWTKSTERLLPTPDDHAHFYPITICW